VFDFDDSIFIHSFLKTAILTKLSDVVIVGSHYLESWSKKYNQNVYLIPTSIDFASYSGHSQKQENGNSKIVVGWIGGATYHYENLKLLVPVFKELVERDLQFKFLLVGALKDQRVYKMFGEIKGLETEMVDELKWSVSGIIPQTIKNFDIGVMPLVNDEWSKGKCSFKAVEYMACSVPAVISLVGENNYLVKNGVNGFVASSTKEWVEAITKLCDDSLLRIKMGKEAERTIANEYSFEANVPKLIKIINSL
ncbi:MAG: glycosyltransferase family 4 protein, partial [Candidatus Staskawiczbacteria bacterium]|nr:glycosyltransferase family 4 protein [Candidatus Staskawiczbacteria bacterium]